MKLTRYLCHVLMIKDVIDDRIPSLTCFHKNSVTGCKDVKTDCDD